MFLSDHQIKARNGMIEPFVAEQIRTNHNGTSKGISYGLSSYGYDARLDNTFLFPRFSPHASPIVDPKNSSVRDYEQVVSDVIDIRPHSFVLGQTIEKFRIPRDILCLCIGKSTYARCGIIVNVTPLEPEWEGHVTIEISNTNEKPARIYAGEGIAQFLFALCSPWRELAANMARSGPAIWPTDFGPIWQALGMMDNECQISYADKSGKYQGQSEVTIPKL